jgi:excisionase family DNA binding protein
MANEKVGAVMTLAQLAEYLQVHPSTVYRLLKRRGLPASKIGGDYRFERARVDEWIVTEVEAKAKLGARSSA